MTEHTDSDLFTAKYLAAFAFAAQAHRDSQGRHQHRKGSPSNPYLSHLMAVSAIVWESGGDEDLAIAGLLHDTIEDAGVTEDGLAAVFGHRVAGIVAQCSDGEPGGERSARTWEVRKRTYLEHLREAPYDVKLVSAADKLHNASAIAADAAFFGASYWDHFNSTPEQSLWYHRSVVDALDADLSLKPGGQLLMARLRRAVEDLAAVVEPGYSNTEGPSTQQPAPD